MPFLVLVLPPGVTGNIYSLLSCAWNMVYVPAWVTAWRSTECFCLCVYAISISVLIHTHTCKHLPSVTHNDICYIVRALKCFLKIMIYLSHDTFSTICWIHLNIIGGQKNFKNKYYRKPSWFPWEHSLVSVLLQDNEYDLFIITNKQ